MKGLAVTKLPDPRWGEPRVARAIGTSGDPWGILAVLRESPWESLIVVVSQHALDQALRGHATPLMRELGPPPAALARRLPVAHSACKDRGSCASATPKCLPGPDMPECWTGGGFPPGPASEVASMVARLWKEGVPVVVVGG